METIKLFKLLFCALTAIWKAQKSDNLEDYLSDAIPFCAEEDSFDPTVYEDFKAALSAWTKDLDDYGYEFVIWYLENLDPYYGDIKNQFLSLSKTDYVHMCDINASLSDEELIQKCLQV